MRGQLSITAGSTAKGVNLFSKLTKLTYRRVVVRSGTRDDFSLRFFSKRSEPTELQNKELIENSHLVVTRQK